MFVFSAKTKVSNIFIYLQFQEDLRQGKVLRLAMIVVINIVIMNLNSEQSGGLRVNYNWTVFEHVAEDGGGGGSCIHCQDYSIPTDSFTCCLGKYV